MVEICVVRRCGSLWTSAVVLVQKKDGIDLCKLNTHTVKDAYALPRIDATLDCLTGVCIFTSLDLKAGYWQVELDEDNKPLTSFTVGPLVFFFQM